MIAAVTGYLGLVWTLTMVLGLWAWVLIPAALVGSFLLTLEVVPEETKAVDAVPFASRRARYRRNFRQAA